jgi:hypothetical protein
MGNTKQQTLFFNQSNFIMMSKLFQNQHTIIEEVLNTLQMIQLKGGVEDKRASRPGTKPTSTGKTNTTTKKP